MWQKIKKPFLITISVTVFILLLAVGISVLYGDKIITHVIGEINKNLTTKIDVAEIDFSVIRKFPNASIALKQVKALPAKPFAQNDTLMYAGNLYLLFDLWDVITGNYNLKKVSIENATLKLITDKNGRENFNVWKKSEDGKQADLELNFEEVEFKNVRLIYDDISQKKFFDLQLDAATMKGKFNTADFELALEGKTYINKINISGQEYISQKKAILNLQLNVDHVNKVYSFKPSTLKLEGLTLNVEGRYDYGSASPLIDLELKGVDANLLSVMSIIPKGNLGMLAEYKADGNVTFNAKIKGIITAGSSPAITINFSTANSQLTPPYGNVTLKSISFNGFYTNRKNASGGIGLLQVKNMQADMDGKKVMADFEIENNDKPFVNLVLRGDFDLNKLSEFYKPDTLQRIEGQLKIDASFKGRVGDEVTYSSQGTAQFQNVNFELKNSPTTFQNFSGTFTLDNNELNVSRLGGMVAGSDIRINGVITNLFSYLLLQGAELKVDADFLSSNLNLDKIITEGDGKNDSTGGIHFSSQLNCNFIVSVGKLSYKKFEAQRVNGSVSLEDGVLQTNSLNMQTMDGSVNLQGTIDASRGDSLLILYNANVKSLNITKTFEQMGNFGQTSITSKNLKGKVTASVQFASVWSRYLDINPNSIYSKCDITIENGELNNYEPMLALSRYVKGTDLHNIKFETLHNVIEIRNKSIVIPLMDIRSTAINLTASGTHSFDNKVDYKLKLELSQLLNRKVKDYNTEFGTIEDDGLGRWKLYLTMKGDASNPKFAYDKKIEDDGLGRWKLYLTMKGDASNPKFAYDKKGVQENIANEIKQEKQTLKTVLNKEFGWFKKDTAIVKPAPAQKKKEEIQIEFDEDSL